MSKNRLFVALLALVLTAGNLFAANPKREMRSTWLTLVENIDWPYTKGYTETTVAKQKQEMIAYLDNLEDLNMTSTCFHIRTMGDAAYPSKYAPWSSYITGTRGKDPGWDPLAFFVEECHKRGIEAYVWLNPYRWSSKGINTWSTEQDLEWKNNNMLIVGDNGTYVTFNPALKETRELIVNVIKEIVTNYAIDGMLFDDYFYPSGGTTESSSAPDYEQYKASGTTMSIGDWRRRNVNDMVADCYNTIKELRPDVRFGIGPAGVSHKSASKYGLPSVSSYGSSASDWQYAQIYCDPLTWMYEGTVDFISPQLYWETTHSTNGYAELTHWWSDAAAKFNCHYYASQASYKVNNSGWGAAEIAKQVELNRKYMKNNNCGSIYYNTISFKSYLSSLGNDVYSTPALTPEITWKGGDSYNAVGNLAYNDGKLTWDSVKNGNAIIRYTVYAVPMSVTADDALSADGDGYDGKYLQKVVYTNSFELPADKQADHWYVVQVFDGYGKEHTAAIVNYPDGEAEKVTITAPVNGAATVWDQEFSWSAIENGSYTVEIASDNKFSKILYSKNKITTAKTTIDLGFTEDGKTYYWRVLASQPKKLQSVSDAATFVAPTRTAGVGAKLMAPDEGASIEDECYFHWTAGTGNETYTIEVSAEKDFATIKYTKDIEATNPEQETISHEVPASLFGKGTFYWRVITKGDRITPGVSEVRSFTVTKISVGNFEPGYEMKTDADSYEAAGTLSVTNLWLRSIREGYKNITFGENGSFNRGMCAVGDYVYVSGRSENSSGASAYLNKYSGVTGELVEKLMLGSEAAMAYYPCNDVIKDSKDNICITNLTLDASSNPLAVLWVNLEDGSLTKVASVSTTSKYRIDHVALWGDVSTGNFTVYAAIRESKLVMRWIYENGKLSKSETCTVKSTYSGSTFGMAPRMIVIDEDTLLIDGGNAYMTLYSFSTKEMLSSFKDNTALAPIGPEGNGATLFTLKGKKYFVYSYGDDALNEGVATGNTPWTFNVASVDNDLDFASMKLLWTLPKGGLGNVYSATAQAPVDYVHVDGSTVRVYMYVPGCGLAAYEITDTGATGINEVAENAPSIKIAGSTILLGAQAESVDVYNAMGGKVAHAENVSSLETGLSSGMYIVVVKINGTAYAQKTVIK